MTAVNVKLIGRVPSDIKLNMRHPEIASGMQQGYRYAGFYSFTNSQSMSKDPRSIYAELGKISNLRSSTDSGGDVTTTGVIPVPWARLQNVGGTIRARIARGAFIYYGKWVHPRKGKLLRPSHIVGKNYVSLGFDVLRTKFKMVVESVTVWRDVR